MPIVNLVVNKKSFQLSCDEGDEGRLEDLAAALNKRLNDIAVHAPGSGDSTLMVMAALMMQDELGDGTKTAEKLESSIPSGSLPRDHERTVINALDSVSEYIENLALKLNQR